MWSARLDYLHNELPQRQAGFINTALRYLCDRLQLESAWSVFFFQGPSRASEGWTWSKLPSATIIAPAVVPQTWNWIIRQICVTYVTVCVYMCLSMSVCVYFNFNYQHCTWQSERYLLLCFLSGTFFLLAFLRQPYGVDFLVHFTSCRWGDK